MKNRGREVKGEGWRRGCETKDSEGGKEDRW